MSLRGVVRLCIHISDPIFSYFGIFPSQEQTFLLASLALDFARPHSPNLAHREPPHVAQRVLRHSKVVALNFQKSGLLGRALPHAEGCRNAAPRLTDPEGSNEGLDGFYQALVLVTPEDEVHPLRDHGLVDTVLGAPSVVTVLVEGEYVEPAFRIFLRRRVGASGSVVCM